MTFDEKMAALAQKFQNPKRFCGFSEGREVWASLKKTGKIIRKKVARRERLFEFEKWIYENWFLLEKHFNREDFSGFLGLPAVKGEPRVLAFAEEICAHTDGAISFGVIKEAFFAFSEKNPLYMEESEALKLAFSCALGTMLMNIAPIGFQIAANAITSLKNLDDILTDGNVLELTCANTLLCRDKTYCEMDVKSKKLYLKAVKKFSDKKNILEKEAVERLFAEAEERETHIGEVLFSRDKGRRNARLYALSVALLTLLTASLPFAEYAVNRIASKLVSKRALPQIGLNDVPEEGRTVVVVTELIRDETALRRAIFNLKCRAAVNTAENVSFALLLDYQNAEEPEIPLDGVLNGIIKTELETSKNLNVFVRKRVFDGEKYAGRERKRGAIEAFNKCLATKNFEEFSFVFDETFLTPQFVLTLDADSELLPGSVRRAVGAMLHPLNKKYDLLTFTGRHKLDGLKTIYSKKYSRDAGKETYPAYTGFYFDLTGSAVYCGKGIYRLSAFREKLEGVLPENRILSHDIIEGAILKTGALGDAVYENAPQDLASDIDRKNRWQRGDLQLLPQIAVKKPLIYNYIIISNALKVLSYILILPAAFNLLVSAVWEIGSKILNTHRCERLRYVLRDVLFVFFETLFDFFLLPFWAANNLAITAKTFWRMAVSKKHLLDWRTFNVR